MKKFASVLVLAMLLSSLLLVGVVFAQTGTDQVTVTVTFSEDDVTLSPDTVSVGQQVNFEFAEGDQDMTGYCVVVLGADDNTPLNGGADDDCMTHTFDTAGTYRVAAFQGSAISEFEFDDAMQFADLTVVEASQATSTTTPAATATTAATAAATAAGAQATSTVTATTATTATTGTAAAGVTATTTPGSLPTTGGESNSWVPVALMLGALALVAGGVLRFAFRNR